MSSSLPSEDAVEPAIRSSAGAALDARESDQFTLHEAARLKGVSYHTVSRAVRKQKLRAHKRGRLVLVSRSDLAAWEPMRARAPRSYRQRSPEPDVSPGVVELASGERFEIARRLTTHFEAIQTSALLDPVERFGQQIAERFAVAMEFDRVALWLIDPDRTAIELLAWFGPWFEPGNEPRETIRVAYDPALVYPSPPDVYAGLDCWSSDPRPVRLRDVFSASLVVNNMLIGYLLGDHDGESFALTPSQIELGHELATQVAITIELRRIREREASRLQALMEETSQFTNTLARMMRAISSGDDLTSILRQAGRSATLLTGSNYGGVVIRATPEAIINIWTREGIDLPARYYYTNLNRLSGIERSYSSGQPVLVTWSEANDTERAYWELSGSRSCLNLPFVIDGELVGAMLLRFREETPVLSEEQMRQVELLAAYCITAIDRQRLVNALDAKNNVTIERHDAMSAAG